MIFVLDVGNTNTVLGVFDDDTLKYQWRIKTDRYKTEDEYGMLIQSLLVHEGLTFSNMNGVIISSVVPQIKYSLEQMTKKYFNREAMFIGNETVNPLLKMRYPNPKEIGADRIVNAVGAINQYDSPLIIIDFGTATTYCYINEEEEYVGGVITPGINISLEALYSKAAKLPKIEIRNPGSVLGLSTTEAMQSGVYFGYVEQVDGIVRRLKEQSTKNPKVIATGGLATLISNESKTIDIVDSTLTLKGLYQIYKQNENPLYKELGKL